MFAALGKTLRATSVHHSNWLPATFQHGLGRVSRAACSPRWVELKSSIPDKQYQLILQRTALCQERESTK